jgi:hypothetical protein
MIWQKPTFWHPSNRMRSLWVQFFLIIYASIMMVFMPLLPARVECKIEHHMDFEKVGNW